jgi:hypothetical protein
MPFTYFVTMKNGKTFQCNNVTAITIATPLVSNGTYRDEPSVVVGGAAGALGPAAEASVAGGVAPSVTLTAGISAEASADSSVVQSDSYTHIVPRYLNSPLGLVFITTDAGIATAPTNASFSTTPPTVPAGFFSGVDGDCLFPLEEILGIYNAAPQGFAPNRSIITNFNEP